MAFLTNGGGGASEAEKARELAGWLDAPVTEQQVVLSYTPFKQHAARLGAAPVLVCGRGNVLGVARAYGFTR